MKQNRFQSKNSNSGSQRTFLCKTSSSNPQVLVCSEAPSHESSSRGTAKEFFPPDDKQVEQRRIIAQRLNRARSPSKSSSSSTSRSSTSSDSTCKSEPACEGRFCRVECPGNEGCGASLPYLEIYDDNFSDMSQAIYHQYIWQEVAAGSTATKVLEFQTEFRFPISHLVKGTEVDPKTKIYGYDDIEIHLSRKRDEKKHHQHRRRHSDSDIPKLDLNGGKKKSYSKDFKEFRIRYHSANQKELSFITPEATKRYYANIVSYEAERGCTFAPPDVPSNFTNQYIYTLGAGQYGQFIGFAFIAIRLIWDEDFCRKKNRYTRDNEEQEEAAERRNHKRCEVPTYVDLIATASFTEFNLDTYEPNPLAYRNGHGYPLRIPVTRDFCGTFQRKYNIEPIAYYDEKCHALTIHVPETPTGFLFHREVDNTGNPALDIDQQHYLLAFDGTFSLLRRKCTSPGANDFSRSRDEFDSRGRKHDEREATQLVKARPEETYLLAQISETVTVKSRLFNFGVPEDDIFVNPIRADVFGPGDPTIFYTGVVAPLMNGGDNSYDVYVVPTARINSYEFGLDPLQLPADDAEGEEVENEGNLPHREGDDPFTTLGENYGEASSITALDHPAWGQTILKLPHKTYIGKDSCPETVRTMPRTEFRPSVEAYFLVPSHEFQHAIQTATGTLVLLPYEGFAAGTEMDPKLSKDFFAPFRSRNITQRLVRMTRGDWTAMRSDTQGLSSYGSMIFWKYMVDQFDVNYQVIRRLMDILANETAGPLFRENDFPNIYIAPIINNTAGNAAFDQALYELFGKSLEEVWFNFSVSAVLIRNNKAIPKEFRHHWPFWIYNTKYPGYPDILAATTILGGTPFADWWEKMDTNQIIPPTWGTPYTGETFTRTLAPAFTGSCKNFMTFSFNVPHSYNTITVAVTQGKWKIIVVQYTPGSDHDDSSSSSSRSSSSDHSRHRSRNESRDRDDICEGRWIQDGPVKLGAPGSHIFQISNHHPRYSVTGNIRLICVNITHLSGDGTSLADYFSPEPNTGTITITSV